MKRKTLLVLTQVYLPDPASVGQHIADAAEEMVKIGWEVNVLTPNRGYDNNKEKYKNIEIINGVNIKRIPLTSFGKANIFLRVISQISLLTIVLFKCLFVKKPDAILVSTSLVFIVAPILNIIRKIPYLYWIMDLNPDQAISAKILSPKSLSAKLYNLMQKFALKNAHSVVSLDTFMKQRVEVKYNQISNHFVLPPWPHEDHLVDNTDNDIDFRKMNNWGNKRVLMYSGNHSVVHPLDTFLKASQKFEGDDKLLLAFVGGGLGKKIIDQWIKEKPLSPIDSLPYQPIENLKYSLSSADIHLVSMGNSMAGCVHPCKIYGAMAIGKPILLLGNNDNHISEIINKYDIGWSVEHGDIDAMLNILTYLRDVEEEVLLQKGNNAKEAISTRYSQKALMNEFCSYIDNIGSS
jgi:colanic acid biosynthesis glycosyl transferase WcaI